MIRRTVPVVSGLIEAGADDRVFDTLLLSGPLLIALIVVLGRSIVTEALAVTYVAAFLLYTLYRGLEA